METLKAMEQRANELKLRFFRTWSSSYLRFLVENNLKHNDDLMTAYYHRVVLLK